jgi:uncharacterized protein
VSESAASTVTRDEAESRYEIRLDGVLAGFTEFEDLGEGLFAFPHTEVDPAFRGRGVASELISQALTDVAARGETIVPLCPVVRRYVRENEIPGLRIRWPSSPGGGA